MIIGFVLSLLFILYSISFLWGDIIALLVGYNRTLTGKYSTPGPVAKYKTIHGIMEFIVLLITLMCMASVHSIELLTWL